MKKSHRVSLEVLLVLLALPLLAAIAFLWEAMRGAAVLLLLIVLPISIVLNVWSWAKRRGLLRR